MRLIGALAFRTHCEKYGYIQDKLGRVFTDFDFASYPRFTREITRVLDELGYEEDKQVTQLFGDRRMLFHDPAFGRHIDVFYNVLDFCHPINFVGRLELEKYTLPLAELLLEKMQIVQINEKDLIDTVMLLREHPVGDRDEETINGALIAKILGNDWGFWRTVTGNLKILDGTARPVRGPAGGRRPGGARAHPPVAGNDRGGAKDPQMESTCQDRRKDEMVQERRRIRTLIVVAI